MIEPDKTQSAETPATVTSDPGAEDGASSESADDAAIPAPRDPDETVGTGSAIALGCIAATLLLIVIGLVFLAIVALLN